MAENSLEMFRKSLVEAIVHLVQIGSCNLHLLEGKLVVMHAGKSDADKKVLVDQAFRDVLSQLIIQGSHKSFYENVISLAIVACNKDVCNATLPVILLADLFDCQTISVCEQLFEFVENRVDIWKQDLFFNNTKNNLLRMCNDLLRRLSRSQNTVFCGRILLFLAKFFPLSERSGLNIVSEFNLDNHTVFVTKEDDGNLDSESEELPSKTDDKTGNENSITVDYNLYRKFWSLQDVFRNPNSCYNKFSWKTFISYSADVLAAFGSFKLDEIKSDKKNLGDDDSKQVYFAKYLTNQKLLDLQLSDHNFRRYVLLQFLILFQYLSAQVKFKPENHILTDEQVAWLNETSQQVYKLLEETPPDGELFAKTIEHILKREEYWNKWKNEGCPEFHSTKTTEPEKILVKDRRKRLSSEIQASQNHNKILIGNAELTRLWNLCPDNMEACRSQKRDFLPSLEDFFEEAVECNVDMPLEPPPKKKYDGNQAWRALRLLSRRSPHFFTSSNQPIRELPLYLQSMIKRVAKELPTTNPEEGKAELVDKEEVGGAADESEDELLENTEEKKDENGAIKEDVELNFPTHPSFTSEVLDSIAREVAPVWKKLAVELRCEEDEITYFEANHTELVEQARNMLIVWSERDAENASMVLANALRNVGLETLADSIVEIEENV